MSTSHLHPTTSFKGKTVVITGASSGVGKAAALAFAAKGATIIAAARREEALRHLVLACEELGARAKAVPTDVTDPAAVEALAIAAAKFGGGTIDVWVNNAGVLAAGPFDATPVAVHDQVVRTNLIGYMHGAYAVLPYFKKQGRGVLINNISIGGFVSLPYAAAYSASKAGLQAFGASLRAELSAWPGIHICDLFPAFLNTPGLGHAANYTGAKLDIPPFLLFDPLRVADAMIARAERPRANTFPDFAAPAIKMVYQLFPKGTGILSERIMRFAFEKGMPASATNGNVLSTMIHGMGIRSSGSSKPLLKKKLVGKAALVAGIAITGIALIRKMSS